MGGHEYKGLSVCICMEGVEKGNQNREDTLEEMFFLWTYGQVLSFIVSQIVSGTEEENKYICHKPDVIHTWFGKYTL